MGLSLGAPKVVALALAARRLRMAASGHSETTKHVSCDDSFSRKRSLRPLLHDGASDVAWSQRERSDETSTSPISGSQIDSQSVKSAEKGGPALIRIDDERVLGRELDWQSRSGFLMKLTATHEPPRDVGGLQRGALSG
jgi:hypothetical protein